MQLCKMISTMCKNNLYLYFFLVNFSNHCFVQNKAEHCFVLGFTIKLYRISCEYKHFFIIRNNIEEKNRNEEKMEKRKD